MEWRSSKKIYVCTTRKSLLCNGPIPAVSLTAAGMCCHLNGPKPPAENNSRVNEDFFFAHKNHIPAAKWTVAVGFIFFFYNEIYISTAKWTVEMFFN